MWWSWKRTQCCFKKIKLLKCLIYKTWNLILDNLEYTLLFEGKYGFSRNCWIFKKFSYFDGLKFWSSQSLNFPWNIFKVKFVELDIISEVLEVLEGMHFAKCKSFFFQCRKKIRMLTLKKWVIMINAFNALSSFWLDALNAFLTFWNTSCNSIFIYLLILYNCGFIKNI